MLPDTATCFTICFAIGGCRLNPQMAKEIVRQVAGMGNDASIVGETLALLKR